MSTPLVDPSPAIPATFGAPRVAPNAWHALGGIWRLATRRFFAPAYWFTLTAMLAVLVVFSIPAAPNQMAAAKNLLPWAAGFYVCFLVPVLAFIAGAGAIRDDLGAGTVDYVFTRPVRRPTYIVFRYLTQMACAQIDFIFALGVIAGIGIFWQVPHLWTTMPWLMLAQIGAVVVFSAFGMLCGLLTSRYVIVGLVYGGVVEVGLGNVPTQLNQISLVRHLLALLRPVLGDSGWVMTGAVPASTLSAAAVVGILFLVAAALVGATALVFSFRELAGASNRES